MPEAAAEPKPLCLPKLSAEVFAALNELFAGPPEWRAKAGGVDLGIRLLPKWPGGDVTLAARGQWGNSEFVWQTRADPAEVLSGVLGLPLDAETWGRLPPPLRLAAWEAALEPALAQLGEKSGHPVSLAAVEETAPSALEERGDWAFLEFTAGKAGVSLESALRFLGGADDYRRLYRLLATGADKTPIPEEWPVEAAVELASERLELGLLKSLVPGDVVLLAGAKPEGEWRGVLRVGRRRVYPVAVEAGKAKVLEEKMAEENKAGEPARKGGAGLDGIEVTLTLELDNRLWQVKDLAKVKPGYVFDTGKTLASPVTLKVNGREWGKGELVDVNGKVGVRLLTVT